ncbi:MAG TPA: hypothetical protein DD456_05250 [Stenotrophomonas sp.]|nr:hypothetical protein [Stenotrophomonas sp.]
MAMTAESRSRNAAMDIRGHFQWVGLARQCCAIRRLRETTRIERLAVLGVRPCSAKGLPLGPGRIGFHACPGAWIVVDHAKQQDAARRC